VSITLPEIIEACDDPNMAIVRIGTSGGLQRYLQIGDFVVTSDVDRAESTSDKIMGEGYIARASHILTKQILESTRQNKEPFQSIYFGKTRTTDDIYFDALASKGRDHGDVLAVSMEFSVFCALRDRYNRDYGKQISAGELLVISDNVVADHSTIDMTEFQKRQPQIERAHIFSGLDALVMYRSLQSQAA
jgi:uridine phosphorylase